MALVDEEHVLAALYVRQSSRFARPALRLIDAMLDWAGCQLCDLTGLAVNIGPGAFTGLRVGLALAHGLALASGKPLVGCCAFDALAALAPDWQGMICAILEARRGEVYAALYRQQDGGLHQTVAGMVVTPAALCTHITEQTLFLGSGVPVYRTVLEAALGERAVCRVAGVEATELAVSLARLGAARLRAAPDEALPLPQPLYIRPADARLPRHAAQSTGASLGGLGKEETQGE
ncbi:hypothetical protein NKDENANG_00813 [Candidatus Entotheonellaceae bacterium PAL068K]